VPVVSAHFSFPSVSVRPSVPSIDSSSAAAACSEFTAEHPAGRRYRLIEGAGAEQQVHCLHLLLSAVLIEHVKSEM